LTFLFIGKRTLSTPTFDLSAHPLLYPSEPFLVATIINIIITGHAFPEHMERGTKERASWLALHFERRLEHTLKTSTQLGGQHGSNLLEDSWNEEHDYHEWIGYHSCHSELIGLDKDWTV
jgi:hypothetical protein